MNTHFMPNFAIIRLMQSLQNQPIPSGKIIRDCQQSNADLKDKVKGLEQQLAWFKRQIFGQKSEKFTLAVNPNQMSILDVLGDLPILPNSTDEDKQTITYQRGKHKKAPLDGSPDDSGLRFDKSVPVEEIKIPCPELNGADANLYELIDTKNTYRLAKRPESYVVLKYIRAVFKEKPSSKIITTAAQSNVLNRSFADVSFLAGCLIDKFCYHQPLYRQHQRLAQNGIQIARSTLTNFVKRSIELLKPIVTAQKEHVLLSRVLAMDETPIKAGKKQKGKMNQAYFWPIYGEQDEVCFSFGNSRTLTHVEEQLGSYTGTLITDGYTVYEQYQKKNQS